MKTFYSSNEALIEILAANGIDLTCNADMEIIISDNDALRIPEIVNKFAPAATDDYVIE